MELPAQLDDFSSVYFLDTEYYEQRGKPFGPVIPVAVVGFEARSEKWISQFFDGSEVHQENPFDPAGFYFGFNLAAEWNCFLSLGWQLPPSGHSLDLYVEFKALTSGRRPPPEFRNPKKPEKWASSLLSVARCFRLPVRESIEKDRARDRILRGHPYTAEESAAILHYCGEDVVDTQRIAVHMLPLINRDPQGFGQARCRAEFMRAVAKIQRAGIPTDVNLYEALVEHKDDLKCALISQLPDSLNVYDGTSLRYAKLAALIEQRGLTAEWPKPTRKRGARCTSAPSKVFSTQVDDFEAMATRDPGLAPLAAVVRQMADMRAFDLAIGDDGRSRYPLFPFDTSTGRCAPPSKRFLFQQSSWTRGLIAPPPGWAVSYLDYSAAEVLIAGVLSNDKNMIRDYLGGDTYTNAAIRAGFAPQGSTKQSIGALRDVFKVWLLSTLYGATAQSLQRRLRGSSLLQAEDFIRLNRLSYPGYWAWAQGHVEKFLYETYVEETVFGWPHHFDFADRRDRRLLAAAYNCSLNFPMQATCAEILRWACVYATDAEIVVHAPVHDALLVGGPEGEIESIVTRARECMVQASQLVLGTPMKVSAGEIVRYPNRMRDPRGAATFDAMVARLEKLKTVEPSGQWNLLEVPRKEHSYAAAAM